ncbi:hypothetical protein FRB98_003274 [Tulasnella sp. 332]|nr:hypothetical protein FRB98_003274 [Tulasnella sp. 332]
MFGPFHGPFPNGKYMIQWNTWLDSDVLNLTSVVGYAPITMAAPEPQNDRQVWEFEYGIQGYRIKNVANGTHLSYSPWALPSLIVKSKGWITCTSTSPVEWSLVEPDSNYTIRGRYFWLRVAGGLNLKLSDEYVLSWHTSDHFFALNTLGRASVSPFGSNLIVRAVGTFGPLVPPVKPLVPANSIKCVIRSALYPKIALELFTGDSTTGKLVLANEVNGEDSQTTALTVVPSQAPPIPAMTVSIRLASNTAAIALWNSDVSGNTWLFLNQQSVSGNADTSQQWIFAKPDFTPVCTTELGEVARRAPDFKSKGVKVIGLSANGLESHRDWIKDINEVTSTDVQFPIIADPTREISKLYDMLDAQDLTNVDAKGIPFTIRTVFVIDPKKIIRLTLSYPAAVGRSFDEVIRVIDALQAGDKYRIATPVNWQPGQDVIVNNAVSNEEAKKLFPDYKTVKPYLRTTADPTRA